MLTATFADGHLTDALKHLACDTTTDPKVRKKVIAVLASWHNQFKSDPSMALVAGLIKECRATDRGLSDATMALGAMGLYDISEIEKKKAEKEEAKKAKKEKEKAKRQEDKRKRERETELRRPPFVFAKVSVEHLIEHSHSVVLFTNRAQEKPQVLNSIASASQASSNLVNAIIVKKIHSSLNEHKF